MRAVILLLLVILASTRIHWASAADLPDLIVSDITYNSSTGTVTTTVKNIGLGTGSSNYYVRLIAANKNMYGYLSALAPGTTTTFSVSRSTLGLQEGATYSMTAQVDIYSWQPESVETNNSLTKNVPMGTSPRTDLIIQDISRSSVSGNIEVMFKNIGSSTTASGQYVQLTANGYSATQYWNTPVPGSTGTAIFSPSIFGGVTGASYSMTAVADHYGYVSESNESNNSLTKTLTLSPLPPTLPDLIIESIKYNPTSLSLDIKYKNIGQGNDSGSTQIYAATTGGAWVSTSVAIPAPGSSLTVSVYRAYLGITDGMAISVYAYADTNHSITEGNEGNNSLSTTITTAAPPGGTPDFTVTDILSYYPYVYIGYKNQGPGLGIGTHTFRIQGSNGASSTSGPWNIPPQIGTVYWISIPMSSIQFTSGQTLTITATVDYYGGVTEGNELNNALSKTLVGPYY